MRSSEENPNMSTIDSYFATIHQIAAERGGTYSHGTTWAAVDSTRDGERVVVEVSFYDGEDTPYYVGEVFDVNALDPSVIESHLDGFMGTDSAELYRKMGQWV